MHMAGKVRIKQTRLQAIDEGLERWHRRLTQAVNAIDQLRRARKRLVKPKELDQLDPPIPATGPAEFNDVIPDFLRRDH
jgi:hypothetical protein